jgi:hypothetical protein
MGVVKIPVPTELGIDRRLGSQVIEGSEAGTWESERKAAGATIDWRFTITNAWDKLKKFYPVGEER